MQRTYSRKKSHRRRYSSGGSGDVSNEETEDNSLLRPRKRQKIQVEVVTPESRDLNARSSTYVQGVRTPFARLARSPTPLIDNVPMSSPRSLARSDTIPSVEEGFHTSSSSPRKPARSASDIFWTNPETLGASTSRADEPQKGVVRRMLGRARTDSSVGSTSDKVEMPSAPGTPHRIRGVHSEGVIDLTLESTSSPRERSLTPSKPKPILESSSPVRPILTNSNIRTYAGKSRSFLVALPPSRSHSYSAPGLTNLDSQEDAADDPDEDEIHESYTELRARWGVDASDDAPWPASPEDSPDQAKRRKQGLFPSLPLPNGMMNDLKSITELRSKGESRRFLDDVGYLFEGLDANGPIGVRRGSAMEIATKLCDTDFARRAKAADFLGRAWEVIRLAGAGDGDKVLDATLAFFAALVARDSTDLHSLASKSDFAVTLHRMLSTVERAKDPLWLISMEAGPVDLKLAGITKGEVTLLSSLQRLIRKRSGLFEEGDIVSNRLLISQALVGIIPSSHANSHFPSLMLSLSAEVQLMPSRLAAYISGLSLFPSMEVSTHLDTPSLLHMENCLRMLDSFLLGSWKVDDEDAPPPSVQLGKLRAQGLGSALMALCCSCGVILRDREMEVHRQAATKCIESALRVLIHLTHDDPDWCRTILDSDLSVASIIQLIVMSQRLRQAVVKKEDSDEVEPDEDEDMARGLDRLCLALGLLTNLVQGTDDAGDVVRSSLLDYNCPGKRSCVKGCRCPKRISGLECLARVYVQHLKSEDDFDSVVRGHMAVLFGLLMDGSPANQRVILDALPGASAKAKLNALVQNASEFTSFYVTLAKKIAAAQSRADEDEEEDAGPGAAEERASLAGTGRILRDSKGETIAKGVIAFLLQLRGEV